MPRIFRKAIAHRRGYGMNPDKFSALMGKYFYHDYDDYQNDVDAMKADWQQWRDVVLAAWCEYFPGTRPEPFWSFDRPDERGRLRIDGKPHPFDRPENPRRGQLFQGKPRYMSTKDDFAAVYETETDYLMRHGLLTDREKILLAMPENQRPRFPYRRWDQWFAATQGQGDK